MRITGFLTGMNIGVVVLCGWLVAIPASAAVLSGEIVDLLSGKPLPGRLYIRAEDGRWFFAESGEVGQPAVRYAKTNWINPESVECHVTLSTGGFRVELPPGRYDITAERGKEYRPLRQRVEVGAEPLTVRLPLQRWINLAERGWYSGETHLHRTTEELKNIVLAEDLNVAFPLSFWVTRAFATPGAGDRNMGGDYPARLVYGDPTHVIWPRNTEYEIFTVGDKDHTLCALFLLNHTSVFKMGTPPWGKVSAQALSEGAMLDMDKLDWAPGLMLPPVTGAQLYELANNHMWRAPYAFTNYVSAAPPYLHPPYGAHGGTERDWTLYTFGMYYTLLNAGFRPVPTAGTASGVHPVPAGFSRVYVHLPDGFAYEKWIRGLQAGRSFVTTGPMLFATVDGQKPGELFRKTKPGKKFRVEGKIVSEEPLSFIEVLRDGVAVSTIMPQNRATHEGARESDFSTEVECVGSGWIAVRCWEDSPGGRFRWAHTAPWHVEVPGKPVKPRQEEKEFLIERMRLEIARSGGVLPAEAQEENLRALESYKNLSPRDDSAEIAKQSRRPQNDGELRYWLQNMIWDHGYGVDDVRAATGLSPDEIHGAQIRLGVLATNRPAAMAQEQLRVIPYAGGRHPRVGFLDGALNPQRDTKISVFTPWDERSYVVVDVPEAIWSQLGLLYLAHEHVETVWTRQGVTLPPLEWTRHSDGSLDFERRLPNGVAFGTKVMPGRDGVRMETWLRNGSSNTLTGLRLQHCAMLKAAQGFHAQTGLNKLLRPPFAACRSETGNRWIILGWDPLDGVWQNPPVPCMHANPRFPDCAPAQTVRSRGWLSFYVGTDIDGELRRLEQLGWQKEVK